MDDPARFWKGYHTTLIGGKLGAMVLVNNAGQLFAPREATAGIDGAAEMGRQRAMASSLCERVAMPRWAVKSALAAPVPIGDIASVLRDGVIIRAVRLHDLGLLEELLDEASGLPGDGHHMVEHARDLLERHRGLGRPADATADVTVLARRR